MAALSENLQPVMRGVSRSQATATSPETADELLTYKGLGPSAVADIADLLADEGLTLRQ